MNFKLHSQLMNDLIPLKRMELCELLLLPNSSNPWAVLVPQIANIKELHQLDFEIQIKLLKEINQISILMEKEFAPDKINIASFGNMVPQLHIHIIARYKNDPAWPASIFGVKLNKDQKIISNFTNQILQNLN